MADCGCISFLGRWRIETRGARVLVVIKERAGVRWG